jgi:tetratricopeptide (TPR) repeat protein
MKSALPVRRLIPKWRPVATTLNEPEAGFHKKPSSNVILGDAAELRRAIAQWRVERTPGFLGDVLAFSVHSELIPQILDVGAEARKLNAVLTTVQSSLINELGRIDGDGSLITTSASDMLIAAHPFQQAIRRLRTLLRSRPDSALALLDMAQLQSAMGKSKAAERSIQTALSLAPNNRTVIRTAARYWVHAGDAGRAHQMLRRHQRTQSDPWLMASEIAIADLIGTPSIYLSKGRRFLVENSSFSSAHLTELLGTIATEELKSGSLKKARDAQRKALLEPNDNMISQAFENRQLFNIALEGVQIERALANSHEAQVLKAWLEQKPDLAEIHAKAWHNEEPFSSRPIQLLSTLYLFQGEYEQSEKWLNAGLVADPQDRGLQVNLAFLKARAGQREQVSMILRRVRTQYPEESEGYARAIEGLLEYSQANFDVGDRMYADAVRHFEQSKRMDLASHCRLFQALYAQDFNHLQTQEIVNLAQKALQIATTPDSSLLITIRSKPDFQAKLSRDDQSMRKMMQLVFDPEKNTLTVKEGLTAAGAKTVVIKGKDAV